MRAMDNRHPAALAPLFFALLLFTVFCAHPGVTATSLLGAGAFLLTRLTGKELVRGGGYSLLLWGLIALLNPLFVHSGVTPLFFLNGNPVTREALLAGIGTGGMLVATLWWCRALSQVMTGDKWVVLLAPLGGRLSLTLSVALRYVPRLRAQAAAIRRGEAALAPPPETKKDILRRGLRNTAALIGWSLEEAVDTARTMRSRGWGLPGRSRCRPLRFRWGDGLTLAAVALGTGLLAAGLLTGGLDFTYYPRVSPPLSLPGLWIGLGGMGLLAGYPAVSEWEEAIRWRCSRRRI